MAYIFNENQKLNQELHNVHTQLAEINKELSISSAKNEEKRDSPMNPEDLAVEMRQTMERLNTAEIKLEQCISNTTNIAKEIQGTKHNFSEAITHTKRETLQKINKEKDETKEYISANFMSYGNFFFTK